MIQISRGVPLPLILRNPSTPRHRALSRPSIHKKRQSLNLTRPSNSAHEEHSQIRTAPYCPIFKPFGINLNLNCPSNSTHLKREAPLLQLPAIPQQLGKHPADNRPRVHSHLLTLLGVIPISERDTRWRLDQPLCNRCDERVELVI